VSQAAAGAAGTVGVLSLERRAVDLARPVTIVWEFGKLGATPSSMALALKRD